MTNKIIDNLKARIKLTQDTSLIILAVFVGAFTGFSALGFRILINFMNALFFHKLLDALKNITTVAPYLCIPLIPTIGGLIVGPIVYKFAKEARGHGVPEVMEAVALQGGIIRVRVALAKAIASAICIGSGGSAGREGPIVQIGSGIGSTIGQFLKISRERMKILVACGSASGISAVFNAPIAGMFFALEIILGDFSISTFSPVIISSVISSVIARSFLGDHPAFSVPTYQLVNPVELIFYALLGILAGVVSFLFIKILYFSEDFFDSLKVRPVLKPAIGGLLLGIIGIFFQQVFSDGYETIRSSLHGEIDFYLLFILIFLKIIATSLTLGSGNSGGIFAPSLFMGAMAGGFFGNIVHYIWPKISGYPGAYSLVGMGAVVAGTTHAPITALVIIFEMTADYRIILPFMISCVIATLISMKLSKESIYTLKLSRRGIVLRKGKELTTLQSIKVYEVMEKEFDTIPENLSLEDLKKAFENSKNSTLAVIDKNKNFCGTISFQDLREIRNEEIITGLVRARDIVSKKLVTLTTDETLDSVFEKFVNSDDDILPVVTKQGTNEIIGIVNRRKAINVYNKKLMAKLS